MWRRVRRAIRQLLRVNLRPMWGSLVIPYHSAEEFYAHPQFNPCPSVWIRGEFLVKSIPPVMLKRFGHGCSRMDTDKPLSAYSREAIPFPACRTVAASPVLRKGRLPIHLRQGYGGQVGEQNAILPIYPAAGGVACRSSAAHCERTNSTTLRSACGLIRPNRTTLHRACQTLPAQELVQRCPEPWCCRSVHQTWDSRSWLSLL